MFKSGNNKQFASVDESVLDLSSGMVINGGHASSVSSMSSRLHHGNGASIARNSSPFNGSDHEISPNMTGSVAMSSSANDFDNDLLSGEDGQGISQVKWTREKIAKLLDLYGKFRVKIEDPKYRKTEIWNKIAKALSDYDGITVIGKQCWDKFRYMKARYLRAREQKRRLAAGLLNGSETSMITFPYFNELQELLGDTPFEQEMSNLASKREANEAFENVDVEDYGDQQDVASAALGKPDNVNGDLSYDEAGVGAFASPLSFNRRKRKFPSQAITGDYDPSNGPDIGYHALHHSNNGEAVSNALSSFMSAVIEMENRKLELFKRFVDLYEKRTAGSGSSPASALAASHLLSSLPNVGLSSHQHHTPVGSRFKRSVPSNLHSARSASSIGGKMSASSSLGAALHSNANNNN